MREKYCAGKYRVGLPLPPLLIQSSWRVQRVKCYGKWSNSNDDSKIVSGGNKNSVVVKAASEGGAISLTRHWPLPKVILQIITL
ncbi:hypothetical protein PIB30_022347 [Stylosanthes scabra]|nr:hypothetical protein [Stylosanthes scabra]